MVLFLTLEKFILNDFKIIAPKKDEVNHFRLP